VDWLGVYVAAGAGFLAGRWVPAWAATVAAPRYGAEAPGHDPEDLELAPVGLPTSTLVARACMVLGPVAFAMLAASGAPAEVVVVLCLLMTALGVASLIDLQYLRLPDVLTYGGTIGAAVGLSAASLRLDAMEALGGAAVGGLGLAGFLFAVAEAFRLVRGQAGLGLGDVKLALSLGATAGWVGYDDVLGLLGSVQAALAVLLMSNLVGIVGGLALTRLHPRQAFPFGPFLVLGWLLVMPLAA
jgi:leader peptidase (prepilin peptidase)/N-methyltransferase